MWRSGERYSEERRHLDLSQRVQEVSDTRGCLSAAVPDERVVRPTTQRKTRVLGGARPHLRIPWAQSRLPSNATVMPPHTQKTPHLLLSARLAICHSGRYSSGLVSVFYLQPDLSKHFASLQNSILLHLLSRITSWLASPSRWSHRGRYHPVIVSPTARCPRRWMEGFSSCQLEPFKASRGFGIMLTVARHDFV
jgi:hypothetical protein